MFTGPNISTDGLVLALDAANPRSYPGSGTTWFDLSGNGNNTTLNTFTYDATNKWFVSVESPGYASLLEFSTPDSTTISNTLAVVSGGWVIEEWIRIDDITYPESPAGSVASGVAYTSTGTGFDWNHGNVMGLGNLRMGASNSTITAGGESYDVSGDIALGSEFSQLSKWYCRTMFWNRTTNYMGAYYNGVYQGQINISTLSGYPIYDGGGISWGTLYGWRHHGARAMIKIYNRILVPSEILQNYNAQKSRFNL